MRLQLQAQFKFLLEGKGLNSDRMNPGLSLRIAMA